MNGETSRSLENTRQVFLYRKVPTAFNCYLVMKQANDWVMCSQQHHNVLLLNYIKSLAIVRTMKSYKQTFHNYNVGIHKLCHTYIFTFSTTTLEHTNDIQHINKYSQHSRLINSLI